MLWSCFSSSGIICEIGKRVSAATGFPISYEHFLHTGGCYKTENMCRFICFINKFMHRSIERYILIRAFFSSVCFFLCYYFNLSIGYIKRFLEGGMRMRSGSSFWRDQHINKSISTLGLLTPYTNTIGIAHH
jgi:hypothetical protein